MSNRALTLIISLIITTTISTYGEKISIKGIDISYNEDKKTMIVSGNAQLIHPKFTIFADQISYNQQTNIINGYNNVELNQNNQVILSDSFTFNSSTNQLDIENLLIEFSTSKKNQQIYITAIEFSDQDSKKLENMLILLPAINTQLTITSMLKTLSFILKKESLVKMYHCTIQSYSCHLAFGHPPTFLNLESEK